MLKVSRLSKRYAKTPALDGIDFELGKGAVLAVLGANGAGKTTLIKCVVGLVHFNGQVEVDGVDVARRGKQARARIGYMPQNPAFHNDLTVAEAALFFADLKGASHSQARELVESVGLGDHAEKKVGALSGGMRQRLALSVALLADPPLLVLDEPASGLDISAPGGQCYSNTTPAPSPTRRGPISPPGSNFGTSSRSSASAASPCSFRRTGWKTCPTWPTRRWCSITAA
jgi:ABC-type multidrug transport system ATPase subunit